ncbi:MAG TPA: hypothetical protein VG322_06655 [Candidatus Acidoferrales bacterium]|jgi:hypothetical protein|nr:hypothetical protein [Candidatus Acidoferrales bacterium]
MKSSSILAAIALAASFALTAVPAHAQISSTLVTRSPKPTNTAVKGSWLKGEVVRADANSIIVREQANGMMIHTFTYSPEVHAQMQKLLDQGGYQYGDKVQILYQQGQTVALRVRGKPSKAL